MGARYVLLDRWDGQAARFVGAAVGARPGAFCFVRGFGSGPADGAQLSGILPPEQRTSGQPNDGAGVTIPRCPESYLSPDEGSASYRPPTSTRIPLLSR